MDDIERAVDDGINNYKSLTKDPRFVPGAGATEIELAKQLASYGEVSPETLQGFVWEGWGGGGGGIWPP